MTVGVIGSAGTTVGLGGGVAATFETVVDGGSGTEVETVIGVIDDVGTDATKGLGLGVEVGGASEG